jgi:hypothetical protein
MPNFGQMIRAYSLLRRAGKPGLCLLESRRHRKMRIWLSGGGIIAPPFGWRELMTPGGGSPWSEDTFSWSLSFEGGNK